MGTFATPAASEILDLVLKDLGPEFGFKFTLATVTNAASTATTTDPRINAKSASTHYQGWWLWVPSALSANIERTIASQSTSAGTTTLTTNGPVHSAGLTSVTGYLLNPDWRPQRIVDAFTDLLQNNWFETTVPLSDITDGDVQASGVTDWTDTAGATSSKVTTASNVPFELARSLRVLNSGANGYARSALLRIPRGKTLYAWGIGRADVGTAVLRLSDASDTQIDTVTTTQEDWTFLWKQMTPGSTVEQVYLSPGGSGASDDTYWGGVGLLSPQSRNFNLPTGLIKRAQLISLSRAWFRLGGDETNAYPATGRELLSLREGVDFEVRFSEKAANPSKLYLLRDDLTDYPLFVTYHRAYADVDTVSLALTETTSLNLNIAAAALKERILAPQDYRSVVRELKTRNAETAQEPPKKEQRVARGFSGIGRFR